MASVIAIVISMVIVTSIGIVLNIVIVIVIVIVTYLHWDPRPRTQKCYELNHSLEIDAHCDLRSGRLVKGLDVQGLLNLRQLLARLARLAGLGQH